MDINSFLFYWYWRYVFRLGNLLNIVEKVTGIDYSCYDIPRTPKVWNVLARNWLQFIQVRNLKWKTYKLETSQSPEYSERKYCLLPFSFRRSSSTCARWWWWWLWWWRWLFASLWWELAMSLKKLRGPKLCLFSKQSCLYCAALGRQLSQLLH